MQTTSSGWRSVVNAPYRVLNTGLQISWLKTVVSGISYFTVNQSKINGPDIIKGGGQDNVSYFDKYQYFDYTRYLKNWSVDRQIGQYPFGLIMAQADVELDNSSKVFIPNYDATIGSGILPNRPLKISAGFGQDSLQQFTGFTGQPVGSITNRNMILHAYDVMDYLNSYNFSSLSGITFSGMLTNITTASAIGYYLGKIGFNANQYFLDKSLIDPISFINVTDRSFGTVLQDLAYAEQGLIFASENGLPQFWNKQHFLTTSGLNAFAINYSNAVSIDYANAPIINDVTVTGSPRAVQSLQSVYSTVPTDSIPPGQSMDLLFDFSDNNGALPVVSVVTPTYSTSPISSSYFTANSSDDGSGTDLASFVSITSTYLFGTSYKITFRNSYTATAYFTALDIYGRPATVTSPINVNFIDQQSIDDNGRNPANNGTTLIINNDYIQSNAAGTAIAFGIVSQYKYANRHFNVETFSNPALQIGDYGTLTLPDTGQVKNVWVTGKTDKQAPEGAITQLLQLEERTLYTYFTINSSKIGSKDVLAP